jgi:3-oxoacyl-[acyl-carrier protein] reductase
MMTKTLEGKTAVVTGGCRGIGKAIVERFLSDGARVFALDYNIPSSDEVFIEDENLAKYVETIQVDVTDEESVNKAFAQVIEKTGRIDILVNNAGITRDTLLMRMSADDWDAVINTNLKGAFLCVKAVTRKMMSQRAGRIINMGSVVGVMGNAGQANYSSSKAGLIGFTKSIAKEFGSRNILVNLIAPGYVITPMTEKLTEDQKKSFLEIIPLKRGAQAEDIANAVVFFAGPDSSYITGQVLHVDGGMVM